MYVSVYIYIHIYTHNVILLKHEKKKELLSFATTKIVLKDIVLNKSDKERLCMTYMCNL